MKYLKRFNESSVDRIDISDIDELKDLFTARKRMDVDLI